MRSSTRCTAREKVRNVFVVGDRRAVTSTSLLPCGDTPQVVPADACSPPLADVEAVAATLRERGLRLLYPEPKTGTGGARINFVHPKDAGGVLVELVEPNPNAH